MKTYLLAVLLIGIIITTACHSKPKEADKTAETKTASAADCNSFHNGTYLLKSRFDSTTYTIVRTDSIQTEVNSRTGNIITAKITWDDACQYTLTYTGNGLKGAPKSAPGKVKALVTKIIATTSNYCVFESSTAGVDMKYSDTLWISGK
jgi:hypothetical protein